LTLHNIQQNTDWKSKYQDVLDDLEARELEWTQIEELLRKTIGRLSIAGRGVDERLDKQLRIICNIVCWFIFLFDFGFTEKSRSRKTRARRLHRQGH